MAQTGWIWAIVLIVVVAAAAWWLMQPVPETDINVNAAATTGQPTNSTSTGSLTGTVTSGSATGSVSVPMSASVSYSGSSFSPSTVTIRRGGTVSWNNTGEDDMWIASAEHPTHTAYDGTSRSEHCVDGASNTFDQCARGDSYSFTFDKVGTWKYHTHTNSEIEGTVVVVE